MRPCVYIVTNRPNGVLYIGVTSDITRRAWEHRTGVGGAFAKRYNLQRLVLAEHWDEMVQAIQREKNLKHWSRSWKVALIERVNPGWDDLYDTLT